MKSLPNLEYLRGFAALLVFLSHFAQNFSLNQTPIWRFLDFFGNFGVDLFFVLSGFVIAMSVRDKPSKMFLDFLTGRVRRVLPLYFSLTLAASLTILIAESLGWKINIPSFSIEHFLASITFTSQFFGFGFPILAQGWTLEYEGLFYLLAGLSILLIRTGAPRLAVLCAFLVVAVVGVSLIFFEFLFGVVIALTQKKIKPNMSSRMGTAGAVLAFIGILTATRIETLDDRWWIWGLSASLVVFGLSLSNTTVYPKFAMLVGQVSYPFYLVQWLTLPIASRVLNVDSGIQLAIVLPFVLAITCLVSLALHRYLDVPMKSWLLSRR